MNPIKKNNLIIIIGLLVIGTIFFSYINEDTDNLSIGAIVLNLTETVGFLIPTILLSGILSVIFKKKSQTFTWSRTLNISIFIFIILLLMNIIRNEKVNETINVKSESSENSYVYDLFKDYSNLNPQVNSANIYRSKINGYRIKIPDNWIIEKGNTLGTEFHCKPLSDDATIAVQAGQHASLLKIDIEMFPVEIMLDKFKQRMTGFKLLKDEITYLANEKTRHLQFSGEIFHIDGLHSLTTDFYIVLRKDRFYNIMLQSNSDKYQQYKNIFFEILKSFYFEDYNK